MPFEGRSYQEAQGSEFFASTVYGYIQDNIGIPEEYKGGGELSASHDERFMADLTVADRAFQVGINLLRGGRFDLWAEDTDNTPHPHQGETRPLNVLRDGPTYRDGRDGRLMKLLAMAPRHIGFRIIRYRNSAAIPSVCFANRARQAIEIGCFIARYAGHRRPEEITIHLLEEHVEVGQPLKALSARARNRLSAVIREVNELYGPSGCEIIALREEHVLHADERTVFVHAHVVALLPDHRGIREAFYGALHARWGLYVSGRRIEDVDRLSHYLTKSTKIPSQLDDLFLRWYLLEQHKAQSFARFGSFQAWYRRVIRDGKARIVRDGEGFRILYRSSSDDEDAVIEDDRGAVLAEEACEAVSVEQEEPEDRKRTDGPAQAPDNLLCGITLPRADAGGEKTSYLIVQNPNPTTSHESDGFNWLEIMSHAQDALESYRENACKEFDLRAWIEKRAHQLWKRWTHPLKIYRDTITLSDEAVAILMDVLGIHPEDHHVPSQVPRVGTEPPF